MQEIYKYFKKIYKYLKKVLLFVEKCVNLYMRKALLKHFYV